MDPSSNNLCHVNAGGTNFTFSRTSFEQPHMHDTIIKTTVLGEHNERVPFFDVSPKIFEKWLAPYIRGGILPDKAKLTSSFKRAHLIHDANTCGLIALAQYVERLEKVAEVKKMRIGYIIKISHSHEYTHFIRFDNCTPARYFNSIHCPDKACHTMWTKDINAPVSPPGVFLHFLADHNGSKTVIETTKDSHQYGYIECELKEYVPLITINKDNRCELVHPK